MKYADSLKGKVASLMMKDPDLTAGDALAEIHDSVRFTVEISPADYTNSVRQIVDNFHDRGWLITEKFRNRWPGPGYRGLNTNWLDPVTGKEFEVQFHTAQSFLKKSTEHGGYAELRLPNLSEETYAELLKANHDHYADVEIPPGAATGTGFTNSTEHLVPEYRFRGYAPIKPGAEIWWIDTAMGMKRCLEYLRKMSSGRG